MHDTIYKQYVQILKEELVPAMGCTEPIALAYAAATAKDALGEMPQRAVVYVSGNIIKNVKSVVVQWRSRVDRATLSVGAVVYEFAIIKTAV